MAARSDHQRPPHPACAPHHPQQQEAGHPLLLVDRPAAETAQTCHHRRLLLLLLGVLPCCCCCWAPAGKGVLLLLLVLACCLQGATNGPHLNTGHGAAGQTAEASARYAFCPLHKSKHETRVNTHAPTSPKLPLLLLLVSLYTHTRYIQPP